MIFLHMLFIFLRILINLGINSGNPYVFSMNSAIQGIPYEGIVRLLMKCMLEVLLKELAVLALTVVMGKNPSKPTILKTIQNVKIM